MPLPSFSPASTESSRSDSAVILLYSAGSLTSLPGGALALVDAAGKAVDVARGRRQGVRERLIVQQLPEAALAGVDARRDGLEILERRFKVAVDLVVGVELAERAPAGPQILRDRFGGVHEALDIAVERVVGEQLADGALARADLFQQPGGLVERFGRPLRDVGQLPRRSLAGHVFVCLNGRPCIDGVMSSADSPSSETDPIDAVDWSVIRFCISFETSNATSTSPPLKPTCLTDPTSTPATRTGAPVFSPATLSKRVFSR